MDVGMSNGELTVLEKQGESEFSDIEHLIDRDFREDVDEKEREPPNPSWNVAKKDIAPFFKVAHNLLQRSSNEVGKTVLIQDEPSKQKLHLTITNKETSFKMAVPLKDTDSILTGSEKIGVELLTIVSKFSDDLVLTKKNGKLYAEFLRGGQAFEKKFFSDEVYSILIGDSQTVEEISTQELNALAVIISKLLALGSNITEKTAVISGGKIYCNLRQLSAIAPISLKDSYALTENQARDLVILSKMCPGMFTIMKTAERLVIKGENFIYSTIMAIMPPVDKVKNKFIVERADVALVESQHAFKIVSYLATMAPKLSLMKFDCGPSGVFVEAKPNSGSLSRFNLFEKSTRKIVFQVPIGLMKKVVRLVRSAPVILLKQSLNELELGVLSGVRFIIGIAP